MGSKLFFYGRLMLLWGCFILILAACAPQLEMPSSSTSPLSTPSTRGATVTTLPTTAAVPQAPPESFDQELTTPQQAEILPTFGDGALATEKQARSLPVKGETAFTVVGQLGGIFSAVAIDGHTIYLGIGPRFTTVDISDLTNPHLLWQSAVLPDVIGAIAVQPGLAFLQVGRELLIYDISDPTLPVMMGKMGGISGEIFPVGDFLYALGPTGSGTANTQLIAIDVADPSRPILADRRDLTGPARIAASDGVVLIASGGPFDNSEESILQLVDRSDLNRTISEIALPGDWGHRVVIVGDMAYIIEDRLSEDPDVLLGLDVSDSNDPKEVANWQFVIDHTISRILANEESIFLLGRSFPHTGCPTLFYVVGIANGDSTQGPVEIDPQSCINDFALAGDILVATSERGLQIFDVSDPTTPLLTGKLAPEDGFISVERIGLDRGLAYLLTTAGRHRLHKLQVLDVSGAIPTWILGDGLDLEIEPSIFEGLDVRGKMLFGLGPHPIDVSDPVNPHLATNDLAQENAAGVYYWPSPALVDDVLYTGLLSATPNGVMTGGGVGIVDISDAANPLLAGSILQSDSTIMGLSAAEDHLIVFSQKEVTQTQDSTVFMTLMHIYDISDPLAPVEVGRLEPAVDLSERVWEFAVAGDTVYAVSVLYGEENEYKLYVLDIAEPTQPAEIGRYLLTGQVTKVAAVGDRMYMQVSESGLWVLNIRDRAHPYLSGSLGLNINDFGVDGHKVYLAAGDAGLHVVQIEE